MHKPAEFFTDNLAKKLADETTRNYYRMLILSIAFGCVALFMTFVNIFDREWFLVSITAAFSVASLVNVALLFLKRKCFFVNYILFDASVAALFFCFALSGGVGGFSPIWVLMLPAFGMTFVGKKHGGILSGVMGVVVMILFWTSFGADLQSYFNYYPDQTVRARYPLVYIVFFFIGFLFETISETAFREIDRAQKKLKQLSETDQLTQTYNRQWFNDRVQQELDGSTLDRDRLCMLIDIDDFKLINDTYGHLTGDSVLRSIATAIRASIDEKDALCRWGGEEFFVYIDDCNEEPNLLCNRVLDTIRRFEMFDGEHHSIRVTVSIGAVTTAKGEKFEADRVFSELDKRLYEAKLGGKNRAVIR